MIGPLKHLVKAAINRARAYSPDPDIRANRLQLQGGLLPDPDFELFTFMDQPGLIVDAGANRGHCALAVLSQTSNLEVTAFEPIEALERPLRWIQRQYPDRFRYHMCALGAHNGRAELLVPTAGRKQATTNATVRRSEFSKDYVQHRLAGELHTDFQAIAFPAQTVEMRTLDSFELEPAAIKIDVEGLEKDVIEGGRGTISRYKPMLMIEKNNHLEFLPILESLGYRFFRFDPERKRLVGIDESVNYLNVTCLHPDRPVVPAGMLEA